MSAEVIGGVEGAVKRSGEEGQLTELWRFRSLLWRLASTNFRIRYANAAFGIGWSLAMPVALFAIFLLVFGPLFGADIAHYPVFLLAALFPWSFLAAAVGETIHVLGHNRTFLKANRFPRAVLPLAGVLAHALNLVIAMGLVVGYAAVEGLPWAGLVWLPALLAITLVLVAGLALVASSLDACYRDVSYLVELLLVVWFYLTPVFYPRTWLSEGSAQGGARGLAAVVVAWNPLTPLVEGYRAALIGAPSMPSLLYPSVVGGVLVVLGLWLYRVLEPRFTDLL